VNNDGSLLIKLLLVLPVLPTRREYSRTSTLRDVDGDIIVGRSKLRFDRKRSSSKFRPIDGLPERLCSTSRDD
jgi:hypothetical protein